MTSVMFNKRKTLKDILWFLVFFGVIAGIFRMWFGLGATTNLTDSVPWGLWKVLNMIAGVALSTCGFTIGFLVYVLKIDKFKPLLKPAIVIAFLGYGSSLFALLFDIGLPDRFWHPLFMWNEHSFLFEVFWCVMLYFTVTLIELLPNLLEKLKGKKIITFLHKIAFVVVIIGISLSSLHHSSLGSIFLITPDRLHSLWYSPLLPLYFFISAAGCGLMFLILVRILYAKWYDPVPVFGVNTNDKSHISCSLNQRDSYKIFKEYGKEIPTLSMLSIIAASLLTIYLVLKIYDLFALNLTGLLFAGSWESWLYGIELLVTTVLPILLVCVKRSRRSPYGLAAAAFLASFGLALNRINVGIIGYFRDAGSVYIPSFSEWALSIGIISATTLVFLFIVENFSIFDEQWKKRKISKGIFKAAFDSISRVWQTALQNRLQRVSLMGVFILPIAFVLMYPPYHSKQKMTIVPASSSDILRSVLIIDGNKTGVKTKFPHLKHQDLLGKDKSCIVCHHMSLPKDRSTPCSRCHRDMYNKTSIFNHENHLVWIAQKRQISGLNPENKTCLVCHLPNLPKNINNAIGCSSCHQKDMNISNTSHLPKHFLYANSYMEAMHKNCIKCHQDENNLLKNSNLNHCSNCHKKYYEDQDTEALVTFSKPIQIN
jgi:Ni/Fe-hydrogenase subunit HybB-like protein